ncbi:MAG: DUF1848 domain-containing protein, partial [Chlorobiaceae bacterium]|nr:DUF1848 domain-containing protein [Chlorobiaceae bacterium]
ISASRATDIPAFYPEWFFNRLRAGYVRWTNPFNANQSQYISFSRMRVIVFWSKNPKPVLPYLSLLDDAGINYWFQFTLNDYEAEGIEPQLPPLGERIEVFRLLADKVGAQRVIWRFDPLILSETLTVDELLLRITLIASRLRGYTRKLVISFADVDLYRNVRNNLAKQPYQYREFTTEEMILFSERLAVLNREWGFEIASCAEPAELAQFGISHNRCIDDNLMIELFSDDLKLMSFLGYEADQFDLFKGSHQSNMKDKGQRKECGCIVSKDIGMYNTCLHLCAYCYANVSSKAVENNARKHVSDSESII